jgi:hypothetical protein
MGGQDCDTASHVETDGLGCPVSNASLYLVSANAASSLARLDS